MTEAHARTTAQTPLPRPRVFVDAREPPALDDLLAARGVDVDRRALAPADLVVGPLAIERKTVRDFQRSVVDKRLFEQLRRMGDAYAPPLVLVLEGDVGWFEARPNPVAMWGALLATALDRGVAIVPTASLAATADVVALLARRRGRFGGGRDEDVRFKPKRLSEGARQRYAVQGLPGIGDVVGEALLERFGSVRRVFAASERDLLRTPGVGPVRAAEVSAFLDASYAGRQRRLPE